MQHGISVNPPPLSPPLWQLLLLGICLKVLLTASNHSTDFDVHHNWLAITHSTPIANWYFEEKHSIWTLDYPPFFAYFEYMLSQLAVWVDPEMVRIDLVDSRGDTIVYFQSATVILTDLLLGYATFLFLTSSNAIEKDPRKATQVLVFILFNGGLLLVDHMHFQYNGYLLGILVSCLYFAMEKRYLSMAAAYCTLVLSKHLFVPLALPLGVYLIRAYCFPPPSTSSTLPSSKLVGRGILGFLQLVFVAIVFLSLAFGPFLLQANPVEQIQQIFSRLFPFKRGLVHAYWAPNIWAIYSFLDRFTLLLIKKYGDFFVNTQIPVLKAITENYRLSTQSTLASSMSSSLTSGLVGDTSMAILPDISALFALSLVFLSMLPAVYAIYKKPVPLMLVRSVVNCSFCSFMFGYHVHEKAILVVLIPLALISYDSHVSSVLFIHTTLIGMYSLFPLFTSIHELPVKSIILVTSVAYTKSKLSSTSGPLMPHSTYNRIIFPFTVCIVIVLFLVCEIMYPSLNGAISMIKSCNHDWIDVPKVVLMLQKLKDMEFMPLMMTSTVCSVLTIAGWLYSYYLLTESVDGGIFPIKQNGTSRDGANYFASSANHVDSRRSDKQRTAITDGIDDHDDSTNVVRSNRSMCNIDGGNETSGNGSSMNGDLAVCDGNFPSGGILKDVSPTANIVEVDDNNCIQVKRKPSGNRVQFKL